MHTVNNYMGITAEMFGTGISAIGKWMECAVQVFFCVMLYTKIVMGNN